MSEEPQVRIRKESSILNILTVLGIGGVIIGEGLQLTSILEITNYNWAQGHLSDLGITMQCGAYAMDLTKNKNKFIQGLTAIIPATIFTAHEFFPINPGEGVFDWQDIGLYWGGTAATYGLAKSKKIQSLF